MSLSRSMRGPCNSSPAVELWRLTTNRVMSPFKYIGTLKKINFFVDVKKKIIHVLF